MSGMTNDEFRGFRCQVSKVLNLHMKLSLAGTAKRLNVEHRTSNIEHRMMMALRFIDFKTSEPQNFEGWFRFVQPFLNWKNTLLDVGRSMFDVRRSFFSKHLISNTLPKFHFRLDWLTCRPAAVLTPENWHLKILPTCLRKKPAR